MKNKAFVRDSHAFGNAKKKRHRDPSRADVDAAVVYSMLSTVHSYQWRSFDGQLDPAAPWKGSCGWLSRWKKRHNIKYRSVCGENASVDQSVCEDWKQSTLQPVLQRYDARKIFNADGTGLFWRLSPDKTHAVAGETCTGGKKNKERITLLVCANMSSTEKRLLLAIGKFKSPR